MTDDELIDLIDVTLTPDDADFLAVGVMLQLTAAEYAALELINEA